MVVNQYIDAKKFSLLKIKKNIGGGGGGQTGHIPISIYSLLLPRNIIKYYFIFQ